jgi:hypothetical protein
VYSHGTSTVAPRASSPARFRVRRRRGDLAVGVVRAHQHHRPADRPGSSIHQAPLPLGGDDAFGRR